MKDDKKSQRIVIFSEDMGLNAALTLSTIDPETIEVEVIEKEVNLAPKISSKSLHCVSVQKCPPNGIKVQKCIRF